ncbi:hypothetical protein EDD11_002059 [Mortierella claussenii]|nr:hypothetical protein EDD11_002059 [Mortierella claussenii]
MAMPGNNHPSLKATSIPDLISEEALMEDQDDDFIHVGQHRPHLQQEQEQQGQYSQALAQFKEPHGAISLTKSIASTTTNDPSTTARTMDATVTAVVSGTFKSNSSLSETGTSDISNAGNSSSISMPGGSVRKRMIMTAVVLPSPKRFAHRRASTQSIAFEEPNTPTTPITPTTRQQMEQMQQSTSSAAALTTPPTHHRYAMPQGSSRTQLTNAPTATTTVDSLSSSTTLSRIVLDPVPAQSTPRPGKIVRRRFTEDQVTILEAHFRTSQWPTRITKGDIAVELGQPYDRVHMWFTNQRHRMARKGLEALSSTSPSTSQLSSVLGRDSGPGSIPVQPMISAPLTNPTTGLAALAPSNDETESDENLPQSQREETPVDGNLGSSSIRYRTLVKPTAANHLRRLSIGRETSTRVLASEDDSKLKNETMLGKIASHLRGGSIASPSSVEIIVGIMQKSEDPRGKRFLLNTLLLTNAAAILQRFVNSEGPEVLRMWIKDAMLAVRDPQFEDLLVTSIRVLRKLPFARKTLKEPLRAVIEEVAKDKTVIREITTEASDLAQHWDHILGDGYSASSRFVSVDRLESARKKSRLDYAGSSGQPQVSHRNEIFQLPKFNKVSPTSRIEANPDFFKEIGSRNRLPSATLTSPSATRHTVTNKDDAHKYSTSSPSSAIRPSGLPEGAATHAMSSAQRPSHLSQPRGTSGNVLLGSSTSFDPSASQHNMAMEALRKQQQKKKTVRFRDDDLVSIRYFETPLDPEWSGQDTDDYDDDHYDLDSFSSYSGHGLSSPPVAFPSSAHSAMPPKGKPPAFLMPEDIIPDFLRGVFWVHPHALDFAPQGHFAEDDQDGDQEVPMAVAEGQESTERDVQAAREAKTPAVVYESLADIPPSPTEPDPDDGKVEVQPPRRMPLLMETADPVTGLIDTLRVIYQTLAKSSHDAGFHRHLTPICQSTATER